MFSDTAVDMSVTASNLLIAFIFVDHILKKKDVLFFAFSVSAESVDCLAEAIKRSLFSVGFPAVASVFSPHLSGRADRFFADEVEELTAVRACNSRKERAELKHLLAPCTSHCMHAEQLGPLAFPRRGVLFTFFLLIATQE